MDRLFVFAFGALLGCFLMIGAVKCGGGYVGCPIDPAPGVSCKP